MTATEDRCPFPHDARKTTFGQVHAPAIEQDGDTWHLRSHAAVRQVLRNSEQVRQGITNVNPLFTRLRQPVIFQDGAPHREQRAAIARFFTPKTVNDAYQTFIEDYTDGLLARLTQGGRADLSELSMGLAVQVAARVIGLTESRRPGMDRRIDELLASDELESAPRLKRLAEVPRSLTRIAAFYLLDVRPAILSRRRAPREDVISHLIGRGYRDLEILIECLTYAAAGMATTREFISVAAWHLLENAPLRAEYLAADQAGRHRLLHELLRLEPVASTLWRRTVQDLQVEHGGQTYHIPAGAQLVLDIRTANADPSVVGTDPLSACPHRPLPGGVQAQVASFGDGAHRCPGAFLAIQESDLFLQRLLRLPLRIEQEPHLTFNENLKSYELRDFWLALTPEAPHA